MDNIICKIIYDVMLLKLWYHSSESMISALHDIIDIWCHGQYHMQNHIWYHAFETMLSYMISALHDIIKFKISYMIWPMISYSAPPPPHPFCHVRWQIRWQSTDFNVSIPSCTGELGRGEQLSLAEAGSAMKSSSLGASLAELGALAEAAAARNGAWQWRRADSGLDVLDCDATCGDEGWLRLARARDEWKALYACYDRGDRRLYHSWSANWDEGKALYTCYRAYKSGGTIPSTTGGSKVKAGSRTGCSSTRRGSPRGLPNTLALTCAILESRVSEKNAMVISLALSQKAFEFLLWPPGPSI